MFPKLVLGQFQVMSVLTMAILTIATWANADDAMPSWNDGNAKESIVQFVEKVTSEGSVDFVPPKDRVAVFDNDGTLWCEAPIPFQAAFAFDEVKRRAPQEAELASDPMVQAALDGDFEKLLAGKHHDGLMRVLSITHTGMTTDDFDQRVRDWMATAKHPRFQRSYASLTFQPMQELLAYLRANGFKCFIVSGGGADFMRVWSEDVYNMPPENVVGSMGQAKYEVRDGQPVLIKTLDYLFVDDKEGKPVGIHQFIGRRPIACFGNSDGDQAMLEYTTIGNPHASFGLIVHHTDAEREYAYDAKPPSSGKLITALEAAPQRGWSVVDMKNDWNRIWSDEPANSPATAAPALAGSWLAEDIDGAGVIDRAQSTLEIINDGSVSGSSCVNRYRGNASIKDNKIKFGEFAMTRRAGPRAMMDQETKFMSALKKAVQFRIADTGLLYLSDDEGHDVLRFSRMNDE